MLGWILVILGGSLEVVWATALKHADSILDWVIIGLLIAVSFIMLIRAYQTIPVAPAYSVFVGIGTVGTYLAGIFLGEPYSLKQIFFLFILVSGIIGLQLVTKEETKEVEN